MPSDDEDDSHWLSEELDRSRLELNTAYEELQSTVEELETTNEELRSTNDELETTNEELRRCNDEIDEVNGFLQAILASFPSGVVVLDRDLRVQVWSGEAYELWGLRIEEVAGVHLMNLDIGLPLEQLRQPLLDCLASDERPTDLLVEAINRRGRPMRCQLRIASLLGNDGDIAGAIVVMDAIGEPRRSATPDGQRSDPEPDPTPS
jgi:two-component system CheB/CheR fusion protein